MSQAQPPQHSEAPSTSDFVNSAALAASRRRVGAILGAAAGPAAGFGAAWSGVGDGRWFVWVLVSLTSTLLGAVCWGVFAKDSDGPDGPLTLVFTVAFGASCGLLAGCMVAFPVGAVTGSIAGAVGAGFVAIVGGARLGGLSPAALAPGRQVLLAATGAVLGLLSVIWAVV